MYFYHVLKLSHETIYKLAELHEINMYNLKKRTMCKFTYAERELFEFPKDILL